MHRPVRPALACMLALALAACGGGDTTAPAKLPAALVGHWQAGSACKSAGCAITARIQGSDLVFPLTDSLTADVQIEAGGTIVSTLTSPTLGSRIQQGIGRAQGSTLIVDYVGAPSDTVIWSLQGSLLRFDFQNSLQLPDVTGDGIPDRLRMAVLFARR